MSKVLDQKFFNRNTKLVARELIGKFLVRKIGNEVIRSMITETEAYDGFQDQASHAFKGKTKRTEVMFGPAGYFYIYLCYGMYYLMNISTREVGHPAAVLIRGVEGADGPGKLTRMLKIDKKLSSKKAEKISGLWIEDGGVKVPKNKIISTRRVGINYAGDIWKNKKLRFVLKK
jgi:DNA-3-methyladenine glycosylase